MIPRQQISDILARTDLLELIGGKVNLQPAGSNRMKGCCPFHDEKTPSFVVYTDKQDYHCFGCGAHGNAINWVMEQDGLRYREAIRQLARDAGITLTEDKEKEKPDIDPALSLLEQTTRWFEENLLHHPHAPTARNYLEQRGVSAAMQPLFRLGYAPPGWDNLLNKLKATPASLDIARNLGLLKNTRQPDSGHKDGSHHIEEKDRNNGYDAFRDRLIFPIHNRLGEIVGFGGRSLHQDQAAKYINSSESEVFSKGSLLYGEYQARQAGRVADWLVVEGYMDVIAMHQHGFTNSVACLGTSITTEQITSLTRYSNNVCFLFDGDTAGRKAAVRAMQLCRPFITPASNFSFLLLPEGEDPDSLLAAKGAQAMRELLDSNMQRWSDFFLHWLFSQADRHSIEGKTKIIALAENELQHVPNRDFRTLLIRHTKELLGLGARYSRRAKRTDVAMIKPKRIGRQKRQETGLLKLLAASIHSPEQWIKLQDRLLPQLQSFCPPLRHELVDCLALVQDENNLAIHLASALNRQQQQELDRYIISITTPLSEETLEDQVRSVLHECWQTAGPDQRQQLVDFVITSRDKKILHSDSVF